MVFTGHNHLHVLNVKKKSLWLIFSVSSAYLQLLQSKRNEKSYLQGDVCLLTFVLIIQKKKLDLRVFSQRTVKFDHKMLAIYLFCIFRNSSTLALYSSNICVFRKMLLDGMHIIWATTF